MEFVVTIMLLDTRSQYNDLYTSLLNSVNNSRLVENLQGCFRDHPVEMNQNTNDFS